MQVPQGLLYLLPVPEYVFQNVTLDLITHLPMTEHSYDVIVTFVNRLSSYTYFVPFTLYVTAPELP